MRAFVLLLGVGLLACEGSKAEPAASVVARCNDLRMRYPGEWAQASPASSVQALSRSQEGFVEQPEGWTVPQGVKVEVLGAPILDAERVRLRVELVNASDTPKTVYVGRREHAGSLSIYLTGAGVTQLPIDPAMPRAEDPPIPTMVVLPAGARWEARDELALPCYSYQAGQNATLHWTYTLGAGQGGEIPITLP